MSATTSIPKQHFKILDLLRGIAALSVVMFHFSGSALPTIKPNSVTDFFSYGKLGVQVFFVISGFIIPYSMYASGYKISGAWNFIIKRLARIGPPSWIALIFLFVIYYGAIAMNGRPIEGMPWPGIDAKTILANLTYSYSFLNAGLYNEVYWTLEIEFQYYVIIAFLLPFIIQSSSNLIYLSGVFLALNATWFVHNNEVLFFRDNIFFLMGVLLFLYKTKHVNGAYFLIASLAMAIVCYWQQGLENTIAALIAWFAIAYVTFQNPVTTFLGTISYSLYITHHATGISAEFILRNLTGMSPPEPLRTIMVFVYAGCAIVFAWLFYLAVEKPFIRFSQKISSKIKK